MNCPQTIFFPIQNPIQDLHCIYLSNLVSSPPAYDRFSIFLYLSWTWHFEESLPAILYSDPDLGFVYCFFMIKHRYLFLARILGEWYFVLHHASHQEVRDVSMTGDVNFDHLLKVMSARFCFFTVNLLFFFGNYLVSFGKILCAYQHPVSCHTFT